MKDSKAFDIMVRPVVTAMRKTSARGFSSSPGSTAAFLSPTTKGESSV